MSDNEKPKGHLNIPPEMITLGDLIHHRIRDEKGRLVWAVVHYDEESKRAWLPEGHC